MRISDWSSDVCSADLVAGRAVLDAPVEDAADIVPIIGEALALDREHRHPRRGDRGGGMVLRREDVARRPAHFGAERGQRLDQHRRSEEHTSELQSLMRISYAVFCLKKKKTRNHNEHRRYNS